MVVMMRKSDQKWEPRWLKSFDDYLLLTREHLVRLYGNIIQVSKYNDWKQLSSFLNLDAQNAGKYFQKYLWMLIPSFRTSMRPETYHRQKFKQDLNHIINCIYAITDLSLPCLPQPLCCTCLKWIVLLDDDHDASFWTWILL